MFQANGPQSSVFTLMISADQSLWGLSLWELEASKVTLVLIFYGYNYEEIHKDARDEPCHGGS